MNPNRQQNHRSNAARGGEHSFSPQFAYGHCVAQDAGTFHSTAFSWKNALVILILFITTLGVFWPATRGGFVDLDDRAYVVENPIVQQGMKLAAVAAAFTTVHEQANWIPVTMLSLQLDTALFGHEARGYHITNVVLHALNACLVCWLFARATGSHGIALMVALLFAWHPLRVESVAWISERKDVLSAFWGLLAIHAYFSFARRPRGPFMALTFTSMVASLMAKPMLVTLPFLLLALDFWPLRRIQTDGWPSTRRDLCRRVAEKGSLFALSLLFSALTYVTQRAGGAVRDADGGILERLMQSAANLAMYLRLTFVPRGLSIAYGEPGTFSGWQVFLGILAGVGMGWLAWRCRRRISSVTVGVCWFAGLLIPVIGLIPIGAVDVADRYTYLPSVGLALACAVLGMEAVKRLRLSGVFVAVPVLLVLAMSTHAHIPVWADSMALYDNAVKAAPRHPVVHAGLALARQNVGRPDEALASYAEAIRLDPGYMPSHVNRALLLVETGRAVEALEALQAVWDRIPPSWKATALNTRAMALDHMGRTEAAMADLLIALDLEPDVRETRLNLGLAYWKTGRAEEALEAFRQVGEAYPNDPDPWILSGRLLTELGRHRDAARHFETARQIKPGDLMIANLLGVALGDAGKAEQARAVFEAAMAVETENPVTLNNFAMLLMIPGTTVCDADRALQLARRAADRTGHGEAAILDTLARAHAANGNLDEATRTAGNALAMVSGKRADWISQLEADATMWRQAVASR